MVRIIRLTESELSRIVEMVINENKMDSIKHSDDFLKLVDILQSHPRASEKLRDELSESLNEEDEYHHYDYGDQRPKKISKKEYWVRRLKGLGLGSAVGALMGIVMAGGISAEDALQMALASAAGVGAMSDTLMRTVGRKKEEEPDATNVEESYVRRTKSDLTRLVKRVINEQQTPDCSKLKVIPKTGLKDGTQGGGTPQSKTWKEDMKKIGNAGTAYFFEGPEFDAIQTQKNCHRAKSKVDYSEFKRSDGSFYTYIGID